MTQSVWGPVQQDMHDLLQGHPDDVPAVVDQLLQLQDILNHVPPLRHDNPLSDFNKLYLTITQGVLERLYAGGFADPAFLSRLDVEFAARYFDALRGPETRPLPSASAGINAHVNFDLPFALVTTFDHLGTDPIDDSDQHRDYLQINAIFTAAVPGYLNRWQVLIDTMNGTLDDWWQGEADLYSSNVAWRNAQKLWSLRHDMAATDRERAHLDRVSADLGRLLLSPLGAFLQGLGRGHKRTARTRAGVRAVRLLPLLDRDQPGVVVHPVLRVGRSRRRRAHRAVRRSRACRRSPPSRPRPSRRPSAAPRRAPTARRRVGPAGPRCTGCRSGAGR